jgi:hypothetical protein
VMQAGAGLIQNVPSARPKDHPLPRQQDNLLQPGPARDSLGRPMSLATPSPCPPHHLVLAGAVIDPGQGAPAPGRYGIYLAADDWQASPLTADQAGLRLLFDDPRFVDAEPVAVYPRAVGSFDKVQEVFAGVPGAQGTIVLADGTIYHGSGGQVFNSDLYFQQGADLPGQLTDAGTGPIFAAPPKGSVQTIRIYASRRDRFDDPVVPRLPGAWELLVNVPTNRASLGTWLPAGVPTVLAGFDAEGKIVRWTTAPKDSEGRQATFYAFAGDHYSGVRPSSQNFCLGCHPGHSGFGRADHRHGESVK